MNRWKRELARWALLALIAAAGIGIEVAPTLALHESSGIPVAPGHASSNPGRSA
jgi:hypothetical protein